MLSYCFRNGQIEVGVIEHEGVECVSLGASVMGKWVTGYTSLDGDQITLQTWCGQTVLDCRTTVIERYHNGAFALVFRLRKRRFIAGYALGDGMLFRGTVRPARA